MRAFRSRGVMDSREPVARRDLPWLIVAQASAAWTRRDSNPQPRNGKSQCVTSYTTGPPPRRSLARSALRIVAVEMSQHARASQRNCAAHVTRLSRTNSTRPLLDAWRSASGEAGWAIATALAICSPDAKQIPSEGSDPFMTCEGIRSPSSSSAVGDDRTRSAPIPSQCLDPRRTRQGAA